MNYGKLTAGTTKTAIDTAKPSEKGEIITYLSRMGDVLNQVFERDNKGVGLRITGQTVIRIIDCDEANAKLRENLFNVAPAVDVVS